MDSKTILELEWNERQFRNQEWDGFKDHFGTGIGMKDSFRIRSEMDSKTILELEWNQRQFQNQEWDGFKDHFRI